MQINGSENECLISITARKDFASTRVVSAGEGSEKLIENFSHFSGIEQFSRTASSFDD